MIAVEHKIDIKHKTDTPYLALTGELWGVCCENLGENWRHRTVVITDVISFPETDLKI